MKDIYFFKFPLEDSLAGAEFHSLQLATHFQKLGFPVKLITSDKKLLGLFRSHGLRTERGFVGWEPTSIRSLALWPLTYLIAKKKFQKLINALPAGNVFFMQSLTEKLLLTKPSLKKGSKVFWLEHKVPGRWLEKNPLLHQYLSLARTVEIITVSNFAKQEFIKLGVPGNNIRVIYPGLTPKKRIPVLPGHFSIGLLSRLDPEKGVFDFLKIIIPHLTARPAWQVLVAGDGKDWQKINSLAKLLSQIKLIGFTNNLDEFFSQISVLVYPTRIRESFGIAALEAMARGIPVIASNTGALAELLQHEKTGFLLDPVNTKQWVDCLEKLRDPKIYGHISENAYTQAQNFSEEKMFIRFEKLLN